MMHHVGTARSSVVAALALAVFALPMLPGASAAQSSEILVLVPPLAMAEGVDRDFGKKVAERVRDELDEFAGLHAIEWDEVEDLLDQFGLEQERMTPIEWRQLGGRMNAGMVMLGTVQRGGSGLQVEVAFIDPKSGDELPVDPFSVADDGRDREAAMQITAGLNEGVEYAKSLAFCSDYLASEQFEDALRNCERALQVNSSSTRARYLRGRIHMEMENWQAAIDDLEPVVEESPSNTEALQSLAFAHLRQGNRERSLELYREYLGFNPEDTVVRLNIAYELANGGNYAGALTLLQEGVERAPDNAELWEYLGSVALRKGTEGDGGSEISDPEAVRTAAAAFDQVLELRGDQIAPAILANVISAHMLLGDYQQALDFSQRAIELIQNPPAAGVDEGAEVEVEGEEAPQMSKEQLLASIHSKRAEVYNRMERYADAAAEMTKALELDPSLEDAHVRRAVFELRSGDTRAAVADFRTAVERGADANTIAQSLFSQAYNDHFQAGRYGEALPAFETALEFAQSPEVAHQIQFFAAYGYFRQGEAIDQGNLQAEACQPARNALASFRNVLPHLNRAGSYQASSQAEIRQALDVHLYR
ncbi:MAG: tetratricopeptide repeat protein, partial [Gemmatimonadota bacterium]